MERLSRWEAREAAQHRRDRSQSELLERMHGQQAQAQGLNPRVHAPTPVAAAVRFGLSHVAGRLGAAFRPVAHGVRQHG